LTQKLNEKNVWGEIVKKQINKKKLKTKQIGIQRMNTKFKKKIQKLNDPG
jgi:hypothetical protein